MYAAAAASVELKRAIGTIPPDTETSPQLAGIAVFDEAIARRSKNPVLYAKRASQLISQRLYQKAIADCNRALQLFPGYYYAFVIRGLAYHHIRRYSTAVRDLERAIYENPSYGYAYASLAATYNATGAYREALGPAYYASRSPFAGDHQLAIAYERLCDNENAVRSLTKVGCPAPAAKKLLAQLESLPNFQPEAADKTSQEEADDERAAAHLGLLELQTIFVNR